MYTAGNSLVIYNLETRVRKYVLGLDGGNIGCFCLHPDKQHIAVGGGGDAPNIYIYEYPSFKIKRVCKLGAERGFAR